MRCVAKDVFLQKGKDKNKQMETTGFNDVQLHLLKMFAFDSSEDRLLEVRKVLAAHFREKADERLNHLWDKGVLNQEKLNDIRQKDLHKTYSH